MDNIITVVCDGCNTNLELEGTQQDWAGQEVECPSCGNKLTIDDATRLAIVHSFAPVAEGRA